MTSNEKKVIQAVIKALNVNRDRLGRLDGDTACGNDLTDWALKLGVPHGGYDRTDKAVMVLQLLVGEKPTSVCDRR